MVISHLWGEGTVGIKTRLYKLRGFVIKTRSVTHPETKVTPAGTCTQNTFRA